MCKRRTWTWTVSLERPLVSQRPDYTYTQNEKSVNQSVFKLWGDGEWKEEKGEARGKTGGKGKSASTLQGSEGCSCLHIVS